MSFLHAFLGHSGLGHAPWCINEETVVLEAGGKEARLAAVWMVEAHDNEFIYNYNLREYVRGNEN